MTEHRTFGGCVRKRGIADQRDYALRGLNSRASKQRFAARVQQERAYACNQESV